VADRAASRTTHNDKAAQGGFVMKEPGPSVVDEAVHPGDAGGHRA